MVGNPQYAVSAVVVQSTAMTTPKLRPARRPRPLSARLVPWHRWAALVFALPLLVQALTGAMLMFRHEIVRATDPHAIRATSISLAPPLDTAIASVTAAYPADHIARADYPRTANGVLLFTLQTPDGGRRYIGVDPGTGRVTGELGALAYAFETLRDLHEHWLAGENGRIATGMTGLAMLGIGISGLIVWWQGWTRWRMAFRLPLQGATKQLLYFWHRSLGAMTALFLLLLATTGALLAFGPWLRSVPSGDVVSMPQIARDAQEHLTIAQALFPGFTVRDVRFDLASGTIGRVLLHDAAWPGPPRQVLFGPDGTVGKLLDPHSYAPYAALDSWLFPLHAGQFGGGALRAVLFVTGLVAATLTVTGTVLWHVRRPRMKPT
jgi:uncharacterized iron-regulated membrane protein